MQHLSLKISLLLGSFAGASPSLGKRLGEKEVVGVAEEAGRGQEAEGEESGSHLKVSGRKWGRTHRKQKGAGHKGLGFTSLHTLAVGVEEAWQGR